jgi:hypothetical protein
MPIAVFASKTFNVSRDKVYTFDGLTLSSSLNVESQDVEGKKPSTYVKGSGLNAMSFNIPVKIELGYNPRAEYDAWEAIKDKAVAYPFILGGKPVGVNKYLLKSVSLNNTLADNKGNILSGTLQLEFEEYVRQGSKTNSTSSSSPGVSSGNGIKYTDILPKEKETQKRVNTNVAAATRRSLIYKNTI